VGDRPHRQPNVAVVVDSASALPPEIAAGAGLTVVPLRLSIGPRSFADGELPIERVLELTGEAEVKTSAPSPGEWQQVFEEALAAAEHVVVLTVSAEMSSTYSSARLAASDYADRVEVIDSGTAAGAEGLVALAAAERAAAGDDLDAVVARAVHVMDRVRLVATVSSIDQLARSGRVPSIAGWAGKRLGVNPLFQFSRGAVQPMRPALSRSSALDRVVSSVRSSAPDGPACLRGASLHALCPDVADRLLAELEQSFDHTQLFVAPFSPVMVAHTGQGLAGIAWWWDEASEG
jgi:DegV family protein with EDD domain